MVGLELLLPRLDRALALDGVHQLAELGEPRGDGLGVELDAEVVRRALLSCAAKGHVEALRVLLPHVKEGREEACRLALLTSCTHGMTATAEQLLAALGDDVALDR